MDRKLWIRIGVGLGLLTTATGCLTLDAYTGRAFGIGFLMLVTLCGSMIELFRMFEAADMAVSRVIPFCGLAGLVVVTILGHEFDWLDPAEAESMGLGAFLVIFLGASLLGKPGRKALEQLTVSFFVFGYLWFLGRYALGVRYLPEVGSAAIFYLILITKGTDIFAFFSGKFLGKRSGPIVPSISPNKTRVGFVGGLVGAVAITAGFQLWTSLGSLLNWPRTLALGILLGVLVQFGDWIESLIKRSTAVKDSGSLLPEFGGFLDVIDSILYGAPVVYYALWIFNRLQGGV